MMGWYTGNHTGDTPGNLPSPYYWWEAGAMFGVLVDYWAYTGDSTYNNETYQALQHQMGTDDDYMPTNQTLTEGNDDQGFWAMAAMTAAELNFLNPNTTALAATEGSVQWLAAAQAVFNEYVWRWEAANDTCNGGLRWQIFTWNNGYTYKNSIATGCFFNVAARLARYTGNSSYADWATTAFEWMQGVGYMDAEWNIFDGSGIANNTNCTDIDAAQWTYNAGIFMHGAAYMYNYTNGSEIWEERVNGLLNRTIDYMFNTTNQIIFEPPCEPTDGCTTDEYSFKGYTLMWMAQVTQLVASTYDTVYPYLLTTAKAAATLCVDTTDASEGFVLEGNACPFKWTTGVSDGLYGVGQQMSALNAVLATLISSAPAPYTQATGGTSTGNAGGGSAKTDSTVAGTTTITTGDRAGAGILTTLVLACMVGGSYWMVSD
ncbi:glycoside hydrolase family 76 protein [Coniella lustricola]|uniref:Mannan endo-1,6-alpha-mannosidase n=1 Tax=Coniella lustricola TaxID=2025994 RepID=A0A2T2ZSA9_9PEZI|nr:glycoside hydrolase family 76 protein [Coniella lustricola]